ncbi:MAG: flagellin lysine-N-methylase [Terracidiphilus sp.]
MRQTRLVRPLYSERFKCIGPACEDSCCQGWSVHVDRKAFEKYQALPESPLRSLIDVHILRNAPAGDEAGNAAAPASENGDANGGANTTVQSSAPPFATIQMPPSLACPFHTAESLCRIQAEQGEGYLCYTCATYPRRQHTIDRLEDKTLTLSCPEAARLVLLNPNLLASSMPGHQVLTWDDRAQGASALRFYFWPIREFSIGLLRNRAYPLWQRLFLLGTFARRLQAIVGGEVERGFPAVLRDFSAAVASGTLRAAMEKIPADPHLQLDMVLRLVNLRLQHVRLSARLVESLHAFAQGIGIQPGATMGDQAARYAEACRNHYTPFFSRHPHILENLLINAVIGELFPFGKNLFDPAATPEPARAFAQLATQFALLKGLLIGVAGFHGQAFCAEHVVATVQTAVKHFEHYPQFLVDAQELLAERGHDNAHGLTMLLRN